MQEDCQFRIQTVLLLAKDSWKPFNRKLSGLKCQCGRCCEQKELELKSSRPSCSVVIVMYKISQRIKQFYPLLYFEWAATAQSV